MQKYHLYELRFNVFGNVALFLKSGKYIIYGFVTLAFAKQP